MAVLESRQSVGEGAVQHETADPLGGLCGHQRHCSDRPPHADQRSPLDSHRIHDGADVVGLLLDRRRVRDLVGQAESPPL